MGPNCFMVIAQHNQKIYILGFDYRGLNDGQKIPTTFIADIQSTIKSPKMVQRSEIG